MIVTELERIEKAPYGATRASELQADRQPAGRTADTRMLALQRVAGNRAVDGLLNADRRDDGISTSSAPPIVSDVLRSEHGQPLDPGTREFMEAPSARISAGCAFILMQRLSRQPIPLMRTLLQRGRDVFFGGNQYMPWTGAGMRLIGHELSHVVGQTQNRGAPLSAASGTYVQRKALSKEDLQKKYGIKLEAGDKEWSDSDVADLSWALSRLSTPEATALRGYRFLRWQDPESRSEADPDYNPKGEEEAGLHEADLKQDIYKISLYDAAFDNATTMALEIRGKVVRQAATDQPDRYAPRDRSRPGECRYAQCVEGISPCENGV